MSEETWKDQDKQQGNPFLYTVKFKDISGYSNSCFFCDDKYCRGGCALAFTDELTFKDMLDKAGLDDNSNFYPGHQLKDVQLVAAWSDKMPLAALNNLNSCKELEKTNVFDKKEEESKGKKTEEVKEKNQQEGEDDEEMASMNDPDFGNGTTLENCLEEFNNPHDLDEDNMWYCWRCKEHVVATKYLQIYRLPPCMIISLKRFKSVK